MKCSKGGRLPSSPLIFAVLLPLSQVILNARDADLAPRTFGCSAVVNSNA